MALFFKLIWKKRGVDELSQSPEIKWKILSRIFSWLCNFDGSLQITDFLKMENQGDVNPPQTETERPTGEIKEESTVKKCTKNLGHLFFHTFRSVCNASWIFFSIFVTLYGPVIYESERRRDHEIELNKNGKKSSADHFNVSL